MTDKKPIKIGDLVTLSLGRYNSVSNTYRVERKLEGESVLSHPLASDCFLLKQDSELDLDLPTLQNDIEKCLFYATKHSSYLGHSTASDLEAICFYFIVRKNLTSKQRNDISNMCGKIASVVLGNNLNLAISTIKEHLILLDDFNISLYNSYKSIIDSPTKIKNKNERYTIFNIAGFILAQIQNS